MQRARHASVRWWLGSALSLCACSSSLPAPPQGAHPAEAAIVETVEYPPPPAQAEFVPPAPDNEACVWLDGHWDWVSGRWVWLSGEWLIPPPGCFFAPTSLNWPESGSLQLLRAHWYPENADELSADRARKACPEPVPCGRAAQKYRPRGGS